MTNLRITKADDGKPTCETCGHFQTLLGMNAGNCTNIANGRWSSKDDRYIYAHVKADGGCDLHRTKPMTEQRIGQIDAQLADIELCYLCNGKEAYDLAMELLTEVKRARTD